MQIRVTITQNRPLPRFLILFTHPRLRRLLSAFRCDYASLKEVVSVGPSVSWFLVIFEKRNSSNYDTISYDVVFVSDVPPRYSFSNIPIPPGHPSPFPSLLTDTVTPRHRFHFRCLWMKSPVRPNLLSSFQPIRFSEWGNETLQSEPLTDGRQGYRICSNRLLSRTNLWKRKFCLQHSRF